MERDFIKTNEGTLFCAHPVFKPKLIVLIYEKDRREIIDEQRAIENGVRSIRHQDV